MLDGYLDAVKLGLELFFFLLDLIELNFEEFVFSEELEVSLIGIF